ncbi:hypothetical protein [Thioalkalivibrio sp. ALE11]|uniref:hypothetical protein n=1 Tax=Thioalkalivibrio sp. ALE11 TaxID=1265494 RepID=UPI00038295F4|nr:hypothetical protein [Thioalkalivibrio sp. ALE11]
MEIPGGGAAEARLAHWGPLFGLGLLLIAALAGWVPFGAVLLVVWLETLAVLALGVRALWRLPPEGRRPDWRDSGRGGAVKVLWIGDPAASPSDGRPRVRLTDLPRAEAMFRLIKPALIMSGIQGAFVFMFIGLWEGLQEMGVGALLLVLATALIRLTGRIDTENAPAVLLARSVMIPVVLVLSLTVGGALGSGDGAWLVATVVAVSLLAFGDLFTERYLLRD